MPRSLSMLNTIKGSQLENFYPKGWDLQRIDRCCAMNLKQLTTPATKSLPTYHDNDARIKQLIDRHERVYSISRTGNSLIRKPNRADAVTLARWNRQFRRVGRTIHPLAIELSSHDSIHWRGCQFR